MKTINHRQKQRTIITTTALIAMVLIITLTIVYAALSTTLNISGSSTISASNWNIKINNSTTTNTVTGTATYTTPTISGSTISYGVGLTKPNDSVTLYFDMANNGDVLGEITSVVTSTPVCTSTTGNYDDEQLVCDNLEISLVYTDNNPVQPGDLLNLNGYVCRDDSISQWSPEMKIVIKLKDSMTELPTSTVNVTNLKSTIIFSQTEKTCFSCFVAGTKVAVKDGYKNIEDIKEGDYVYSYNLKNNKKELSVVNKTYKNITNEIYTIKVNNEIIKTTATHPFYDVNHGWIRVEKLNFNNKLLGIKTGPLTISAISKNKKENIEIYNIEVDRNHNYLITEEDILVHNKDIN